MTDPKTPFTVKAIYQYSSDVEDDLNFDVGQVITVKAIENDEWWFGEYDNKEGIFPKNFVEVLQPPAVPVSNRPIKKQEPVAGPIDHADDKVTDAPHSSPPKLSSSPPLTSPAGKVPLPQTFSKPKDPYSIKKQFVAAPSSTYVPKIQPRDESNLVAHPVHETKHSEDVVKSTSQGEHNEDDDAGPKISLKERIALLQKKQQEEAEREAAALKRKEEKKKKQAEERERVKHLREQKSGEQHIAPPEESELSAPGEPSEKLHSHNEGQEAKVGDREEDEVESDAVVDHTHPSEDKDVEGEEEQEEEEEEEEEEDEEMKRQKLVERMSRISGGRNMFGMMGMATPFGAPGAAQATKNPKDAKTEVDATDSDSRRRNSTKAAELTAPEPPMSAPSVPTRVTHESSSMAEDDEPSDSDQAEFITQKDIDKQEHEGDDRARDEILEGHENTISIQKHRPLEGEGTGYEADEDLDAPSSPNRPLDVEVPPPIPQRHASEKEIKSDRRRSHPPPPPPPVDASPPPPPPPLVHASPSQQPPRIPVSPSSLANVEERGHIDSSSEDEQDDDDAFKSVENSPQHTAPPRAHTIAFSNPPIPGHPPPIPEVGPPPPSVPIGRAPARASTEVPPLMHTSTGASLGSRKSTESVSRSRSLKGIGGDQNEAEVTLKQLEMEIANIKSTSTWWLKKDLPESLVSRIGVDLVYEVDTNKIKKRGGRVTVFHDYYVLFYDLSQLIFELEFEESDPKSTVRLANSFTKPAPPIKKDVLENNHRQLGSEIVNIAAHYLGSKLDGNLITRVFQSSQLKHKLLPPIGNKSYGVTIYKNFNNSNVSKIDDIKAGDILWIKNGKFSTHKTIIGSKSVTVGEGSDNNPLAAVIYDYNPDKEKFKVVEQDASGHVKKESYKIGEFKSGRIRVFRPVGRDYVW